MIMFNNELLSIRSSQFVMLIRFILIDFFFYKVVHNVRKLQLLVVFCRCKSKEKEVTPVK